MTKKSKTAKAISKTPDSKKNKEKVNFKFTDKTVLAKCKDVLSRRNVDGTVSVMRLDNDNYFFTIDGIAAEIWSLIDGSKKLEDIKRLVSEKYETPDTAFDNDVSALLIEFKKEKLLK